ncbi:MAG TPA: SBBP repeat-containing protein [Candidatus Acidoferrales bacterium]|nr:SBBP repeat-containing protein [Candidatus Acidoferrales bacterium]
MNSKARILAPALLVVFLSVFAFYMAPTNADQTLALTRIYGSGVTVDNEGALLVIGSSAPFSNGMAQSFWFKYVSSLPDSPNPQPDCMKTFGNAEPLQTWGYSVVTDSSNSIWITGATQTFGGENYNVFLQKFDESCHLLFTLQWAGAGNDIPHGLAVDAEDNVYVVGSTTSFSNGMSQIFLLKYSSAGEFQWAQRFGGIKNDYGNGVAVDSNGNIYVAGTTSSYGAGGTNGILLKYDSFGNLIYYRTWGGSQNSYGTGVAVDSGGYVYETGYTYSLGPKPGTSAVILLKYDPNGTPIFQDIWGGTQNDFASGVAVDFDGHVYVVGYTKTFDLTPGIPSAFLLKFNPDGTLLFQKIWGGNRGDFAYAVAVDLQEHVYVTGYTYSFGPNTQGPNFFVLKYDYSGNLQWEKIYGGGIPDP